MPSELGWNRDWNVAVRVWMERAGRPILGKGRLDLLEAIDRWHSISEAARQLGMSYRHAWLLVQSINEAAAEPLVESVVGGRRGGGARLTPRGRRAATVFREVQDQLRALASSLLPRLSQRSTEAPAVHVVAAVSLEGILGDLLADFAVLQPTITVRTVFGASDELATHLLAGAPADLFLSADARQVDRLAAAGLVKTTSRTVLAGNHLAAVAPVDRPAALRKPVDLLHPKVRRLALASPVSPLGSYTRTYLEALGLYDRLASKVIHLDSSRAVVDAIRAGWADAGLVYGSDAATASGIRLLFRAHRPPAAVQYVAAVLHSGHLPVPAETLLGFLTSAKAARQWRRWGFLRPRRTG